MVTFEINFEKNYQSLCFVHLRHSYCIMHQSIPAAPSVPPPPPGYCRAFARLVSPWGGTFANFALPGGRAFASPGAIPELLTRTQFPITI